MSKPKILLMHRNTFGQFEFFGKWLAENGWDVTFAMGGDGADQIGGAYDVRYFKLSEAKCAPNDFRYPVEFSAQNTASAATWMMQMREAEDYQPDIVIAHVGWGVGLCVKTVWPRCKYIAYHEWYYTNQDWSKGGKIEKPTDLANMVVNRLRNMPITAEFDSADENWCPTHFQASRFPPQLQQMLSVVPDGVDCDDFAPDPGAQIDIDGIDLPEGVPVITYATRGMEPVRGFPQFMRALSLLQKRRDDFHTLIVANDTVAYGPQLPQGQSWRAAMLERYDFDESRMHMHKMLPRDQYRQMLQGSAAHIYFTEPFVTSWSLSDALASGCLVIGSLTGPVEELVTDMETGILVDMDDPEDVADMIEWVLDHPQEAAAIRAKARAQMLDRYAAAHVFPAKETRLRALLAGGVAELKQAQGL